MKITSFIITLLVCATSAACGSKERVAPAATETIVRPAFNADSAYAYVRHQIEFGPRVPGTEAHRQCGEWIADRLRAAGAEVRFCDTIVRSVDGRQAKIRNIIGHFRPDARRRVMLLAHYDTRPWADMDPDPDAHNRPIDGANDGASGVAVILEAVRHIDSLPESLGLDILFVDQEDSGDYNSDDSSWCLGAQAYAASLTPTAQRPEYAILLDMVGGKGAVFTREQFSEAYARHIVDRVWQAAASLGYADRFLQRSGGAINDDHIHLLGAGIPTIDIIEMSHPETGSFNPTWHTLADNLANIDPATLRIVGETVLKTLAN